jgi:Zn-dependent protease with chaperone function
LSKVNILPLLFVQGITAIALFWLLQQTAFRINFSYTLFLIHLPFLHLSRDLFDPPVWSILIPLGILLIGSRWILDSLLIVFEGLQPLSLERLAAYSPETGRSLQRLCRQQRIPLPTLGLLPTTLPVVFSYGCLPRFTRVVVSRGLLEQLADDEIATIYASEIGHIRNWDIPLLSLITVVLQIPYTLYRLAVEWGNRQTKKPLRVMASLIAAIGYGFYWWFRWTGLWLSRKRTDYSDRMATELTGNPNGLARALLKIAIGTAKDIQAQEKTTHLLEGFDLLAPLGHRLAGTLGSVYPYAPMQTVLEWERSNPYRRWLAISESHALMGDRLNQLMSYARYWQLPTELEFSNSSLATVRQSRKLALTAQQWRRLLLQGAPFFGLLLGLTIVLVFYGIGWVALQLNMRPFFWLYRDASLFYGLPLIGFSLGTVIRMNRNFPDIPFRPSGGERSQPLAELLSDPETIPIDSIPSCLEGKLLGRPSLGSQQSQDLLLQTATGMVRLHCTSAFGPIGNLLPHEIHPTDLLQQEVTVTGWFRRGVTPWIDVETLRTSGGRTSRSNHPIWSTILAAIAGLGGAYIIFSGGIH